MFFPSSKNYLEAIEDKPEKFRIKLYFYLRGTIVFSSGAWKILIIFFIFFNFKSNNIGKNL